MVNVIVFVPSPDQLKYVEGLVRDMQTDEVHIDAVHRFGNPEILNHLDSYDVILARGISYRMIREAPMFWRRCCTAGIHFIPKKLVSASNAMN